MPSKGGGVRTIPNARGRTLRGHYGVVIAGRGVWCAHCVASSIAHRYARPRCGNLASIARAVSIAHRVGIARGAVPVPSPSESQRIPVDSPSWI